jgi:hypothetical protein
MWHATRKSVRQGNAIKQSCGPRSTIRVRRTQSTVSPPNVRFSAIATTSKREEKTFLKQKIPVASRHSVRTVTTDQWNSEGDWGWR